MAVTNAPATATFENVSVSASQDFFEILPDPRNILVIHSLELFNVGGTADAGDAQEEFLRVTIRYLSGFTQGSGGSAPTPADVSVINPAGGVSSAAVALNNTTKATATNYNAVMGAYGWNVRVPFVKIWTPETRPHIPWDTDNDVAALVVVRLEAAPADAIAMSGTLTYQQSF